MRAVLAAACYTEVAFGAAGWADRKKLALELTLEAYLALQAEPRPSSSCPTTEAEVTERTRRSHLSRFHPAEVNSHILLPLESR